MSGSTKLNASQTPFISKFTVENSLWAEDAGTWPRYCATWWIILYLILVRFHSGSQRWGRLFMIFFFLLFFLFKWACVWPHQDMTPRSARVPERCRFMFPQSHADIWRIMGSAEIRTLQLPWLLTDIQTAPQVFWSRTTCSHAVIMPQCQPGHFWHRPEYISDVVMVLKDIYTTFALKKNLWILKVKTSSQSTLHSFFIYLWSTVPLYRSGKSPSTFLSRFVPKWCHRGLLELTFRAAESLQST